MPHPTARWALAAAFALAATAATAPARAQPEPEPAGLCADGPACFSAGAAAYAAADYTTSLARFQRACDLRYAAGCAAVGEHLALGRGVAKDATKALALYQAACEAGAYTGCAAASRAYREGVLAPQDVAQAFRWQGRACDLGAAAECANLGQRNHDGDGLPKDLGRALALYAKACDLGSAPACNNLGLMHRKGEGTPVDESRARALLQRACDLKAEVACKNLGVASPPAAPAAPAPAPLPPAKRCEAGDLQACVDYGLQLELGDGVPKNVARARHLYDKACAGGNDDGCVSKGMLLVEADRPDFATARQLFEAACQRGSSFGCRNLGFWYDDERRSTDASADRAMALKYFRQACGPTDPDGQACGEVAKRYYIDAQFTPGDLRPFREGLPWAERGCALDDPDACEWAGLMQIPLGAWGPALDAYAKACALGSAHACSEGGFQIGPDGQAPKKDPARAALFDACGRGDKAKCAALWRR